MSSDVFIKAGGKLWPSKFIVAKEHAGKVADTVIADNEASPEHMKPSVGRAVKVCAVCLVLWWAPVLLLGAWLGWNHAVFCEGVFFSKAAMITFGGAYAVVPYVSQQAVEHSDGWTLGRYWTDWG